MSAPDLQKQRRTLSLTYMVMCSCGCSLGDDSHRCRNHQGPGCEQTQTSVGSDFPGPRAPSSLTTGQHQRQGGPQEHTKAHKSTQEHKTPSLPSLPTAPRLLGGRPSLLSFPQTLGGSCIGLAGLLGPLSPTWAQHQLSVPLEGRPVFTGQSAVWGQSSVHLGDARSTVGDIMPHPDCSSQLILSPPETV